MINNQGIYSHQINKNPHLDIYTHDELPINEQFEDRRSNFLKVVDMVAAIFRDLIAVLCSVPSRILTFFNYNPYSEYCDPQQAETWNKWKEDSAGLHLLTHGFKGHPSIWNGYIDALQEKEPLADVRVPFVPKTGNCALEHATESIREMVKTYIDDQIAKKENTVIPITLYGVSNGTRISLNILNGLINQELDDRLKTKGLRLAFKVDAIAGVLRGTTHWSLRAALSSRFTHWITRTIIGVDPIIMEEFQYKSEASTKLIEATRNLNNTANILLNYHFYTSTDDGSVVPHYSALPILGKGETHHFVHGEGHTSIVDRVRNHILETSAETDWHRALAV